MVVLAIVTQVADVIDRRDPLAGGFPADETVGMSVTASPDASADPAQVARDLRDLLFTTDADVDMVVDFTTAGPPVAGYFSTRPAPPRGYEVRGRWFNDDELRSPRAVIVPRSDSYIINVPDRAGEVVPWADAATVIGSYSTGGANSPEYLQNLSSLDLANGYYFVHTADTELLAQIRDVFVNAEYLVDIYPVRSSTSIALSSRPFVLGAIGLIAGIAVLLIVLFDRAVASINRWRIHRLVGGSIRAIARIYGTDVGIGLLVGVSVAALAGAGTVAAVRPQLLHLIVQPSVLLPLLAVVLLGSVGAYLAAVVSVRRASAGTK
ncbi:hypothetical protein [Promicromonospora sp. NFX87]|uniref:hypothetical protein n=1 Tax=Promicromonospora sp. NFX87 TaxID=3402691 RepID=UPI003AFA7372